MIFDENGAIFLNLFICGNPPPPRACERSPIIHGRYFMKSPDFFRIEYVF